MPQDSQRGFTLVEVLIVVVILGVLAVIAVPQAANASRTAAHTAFARNTRTLVDAAVMHRTRTGTWIGDGSSGQIPDGLEAFIDPQQWENGTPIGGLWDSETRPDDDLTLGIGVHFMGAGGRPDDREMRDVDALLDDGDLATGTFRQFDSDRFYYIVEY
ncbi:MAG: hypothetical protein KatS3mg103_0537 [Phycisphaerales bacterium]|nr:MAG: hypothetical protein KatS3mg103_0537 [Phycisphaerales bacterium]